MVETFSRQMYILTHTYTHTLTRIRAHARPLTHTDRQAALNVGHWALLSLKRAETVPKPPLQSDCFRTQEKKTPFTGHSERSQLAFYMH